MVVLYHYPERIKTMLPRFVDYVVWREENGEGVLEVALFPKLFLTAEDTTLKAMLSEVVKRDGSPGACGSGEPLFHGSVPFGVPPVPRRETSQAARNAITLSEQPGKRGLLPSRTLLVRSEGYSRYAERHRVLELSPKPKDLPDGPVDQRAWRQYQSYLSRIRPVARADFYKRLMERQVLKTVRAVARVTGEDWSRVAKVLKILELPEPVLEHLRTHDSPEVVKCFTEGRLRKLLGLKDPRAIWNRFRTLLQEIGLSADQ